MAATVVSCWRSREELDVVLLDESLCQPPAHSFTHLHTRTRTHVRARDLKHTLTRRHVRLRERERGGRGRAPPGRRGLPNQSAPPGPLSLHWRASGTRAPGHSGGHAEREGDGTERRQQRQLEETDPDPDSAEHRFSPPSDLKKKTPSRPASSAEITPRYELLLLNLIDAELSGPVLSSSVSPPLSLLSLCLLPGL